MDISNVKVPTTSEAANQAIRETVARRERIERLQAEFNEVEIDSVIATPATPESLAELAQHIRESCQLILAVPEGWWNSKEFKLSLDCLQKLLVDYHYQADSLAARIV